MNILFCRVSNCLDNGEWSVNVNGDNFSKDPVPKCDPITCPAISGPDHGKMVGVAPHNVGDMVKFQCDSGFMMEGQPVATCIEEKNLNFNQVGAVTVLVRFVLSLACADFLFCCFLSCVLMLFLCSLCCFWFFFP